MDEKLMNKRTKNDGASMQTQIFTSHDLKKRINDQTQKSMPYDMKMERLNHRQMHNA